MKKSTLQSITGIILTICLALSIQPVQAAAVPQAIKPSSEQAALVVGEPFVVSVDNDAKSGIPGSIVVYTFTIANNSGGSLDVNIDAPFSTQDWTPAPSVDRSSFSIPDTESASFKLAVPIPSGATAGQNDIERISGTVGGTAFSKTVTTTVKAVSVPGRPVVMIAAYYINSGKIGAGSDFELAVKLENTGSSTANNIIVAYDGGSSFYPKTSGGVDSVADLSGGKHTTIDQTFTGAGELAWLDIAMIKVTISYSDSAGISYSDVFSLNFNISTGSSSGAYATATPASADQPQLVITGYKIDAELLQPGTTFNLDLDVKNMGRTDASSVTMILGGGGSSSSSESDTPQPGGLSGSGSELTNFAPLNSSNLVYVGDVKKDATVSLSQKLIVNVSTEPGVYTLKLSFVYTDAKGNRIVDDQVITLLVYSLPKLEVSFYRDPGMFFAGSPSVLPIQVTNLGKKTSVLGNMKVTAAGEEIMNDVSLVGALDPGGYYTLDAEITPLNAGPLDIVVTINYNDDFNQPRTLVQKINIEVQPMLETTPEGSAVDEFGNPIDPNAEVVIPETFGHKILRFFKGMIGLDSGETGQDSTSTESAPVMVNPKG